MTTKATNNNRTNTGKTIIVYIEESATKKIYLHETDTKTACHKYSYIWLNTIHNYMFLYSKAE